MDKKIQLKSTKSDVYACGNNSPEVDFSDELCTASSSPKTLELCNEMSRHQEAAKLREVGGDEHTSPGSPHDDFYPTTPHQHPNLAETRHPPLSSPRGGRFPNNHSQPPPPVQIQRSQKQFDNFSSSSANRKPQELVNNNTSNMAFSKSDRLQLDDLDQKNIQNNSSICIKKQLAIKLPASEFEQTNRSLPFQKDRPLSAGSNVSTHLPPNSSVCASSAGVFPPTKLKIGVDEIFSKLQQSFRHLNNSHAQTHSHPPRDNIQDINCYRKKLDNNRETVKHSADREPDTLVGNSTPASLRTTAFFVADILNPEKFKGATVTGEKECINATAVECINPPTVRDCRIPLTAEAGTARGDTGGRRGFSSTAAAAAAHAAQSMWSPWLHRLDLHLNGASTKMIHGRPISLISQIHLL